MPRITRYRGISEKVRLVRTLTACLAFMVITNIFFTKHSIAQEEKKGGIPYHYTLTGSGSQTNSVDAEITCETMMIKERKNLLRKFLMLADLILQKPLGYVVYTYI